MSLSHLLKLATLNVTKAAASTRDGIEAEESSLPHMREDLQRCPRRREYWDLTHKDLGALEEDEDPLAEAMGTDDLISTQAPSKLAAPLASNSFCRGI